MRIRWKRSVILLGAVAVPLLLLFLPGRWSARTRHTIKKTIAKAEITLERWRGHEPRSISIAGKLNEPGIQIQALDSRSGWATLADESGQFVLPDLIWYPGASYELVISQDQSAGRLIKFTAPKIYPENGVFDVGELNGLQGDSVEIGALAGLTSISREDPERASAGYYKELFEKIVADQSSDEAKMQAVCDYVFSKATPQETPFEMEPREVLEQGSRYCGHLSAAMKALLVAGGYKSRGVNITDGMSPPGTHIVVEVYYDGGWHLYDPTYGVSFRNTDGQIASYKNLRLDRGLISEELFQSVRRKIRHRVVEQIKAMYATGYHHFYELED